MQKGMNEFDALESSIKGCVPINPYFSWHFPFIFLQNLFWIWSHEQIGFGELIRRSNRLDNNKVESVWEEYTNIMDNVKNLWSRYLQWVSENPTLATDMETSIKWISLIATGRHYWSDIEIFFSFYFWTTGYLRNSTNSLLWSELAYSASDLFKFINDRAYEQAFQATNAIKYENIEQLLAFLDSAEIFLEIGASLVAGDAAKWIMVSILQVLK